MKTASGSPVGLTACVTVIISGLVNIHNYRQETFVNSKAISTARLNYNLADAHIVAVHNHLIMLYKCLAILRILFSNLAH
jgi:hypothetical protein